MKREPKIFLEHILESINSIEYFSQGLTKDKLAQDDLRKSAIINKLEIIGEAVKNLPKEFTEKHKDVPWKDIAGTRDRVIHRYFDIDLEIIWKTLKIDLPDLKLKIKKILSSL